MPPEWSILGALGSALIAGVVAYAVARGNRRASPYEALAGRVVTLESKVATLEGQIEGLEKENTAYRFRVGRLVAHIDVLTGLLFKHAPGINVPRLDEADRQA